MAFFINILGSNYYPAQLLMRACSINLHTEEAIENKARIYVYNMRNSCKAAIFSMRTVPNPSDLENYQEYICNTASTVKQL